MTGGECLLNFQFMHQKLTTEAAVFAFVKNHFQDIGLLGASLIFGELEIESKKRQHSKAIFAPFSGISEWKIALFKLLAKLISLRERIQKIAVKSEQVAAIAKFAHSMKKVTTSGEKVNATIWHFVTGGKVNCIAQSTFVFGVSQLFKISGVFSCFSETHVWLMVTRGEKPQKISPSDLCLECVISFVMKIFCSSPLLLE